MKVSVIDVAAALVTNGQFTPFRALSRLYNRAEFRTSITPPITVDIADLDGGSSQGPSWIMELLRPTLTLSGPEGVKVIAPAGEAGHSGGIAGVALLAGLIGLPYLFGMSVGTRRRR